MEPLTIEYRNIPHRIKQGIRQRRLWTEPHRRPETHRTHKDGRGRDGEREMLLIGYLLCSSGAWGWDDVRYPFDANGLME